MAASPASSGFNEPSGEPALPAQPTRYVHPGHVVVCDKPTILHTILGSCVSVCLWDAEAAVGGLNHFVMPDLSGPRSARFAEPAVEDLISQVLALGARRPRLRARLFGGAWLLPVAAHETPIGARNVQRARELLSAHQIPVLSEDVLGHRGRKLLFETATGATWLRMLSGGMS